MPRIGLKENAPAVIASLALPLLCVGLTACGSSSGGSPANASTPAAASAAAATTSSAAHKALNDPVRRRAAMQVTKCMHRNGVDVPEPGPSGYITIRGALANSRQFHAATANCRNVIAAALHDGR